MVKMKIRGQTGNFMIDTAAEHSVVTQKVAPLSGQEVTIIGATRDHSCRPFCRPHRCQLGGHQVVHEFLYLPVDLVPLMGRDLLAKMEAETTFTPDGSAQPCLGEETSPMILSLAVPREEEWRLYIPQPKASTSVLVKPPSGDLGSVPVICQSSQDCKSTCSLKRYKCKCLFDIYIST